MDILRRLFRWFSLLAIIAHLQTGFGVTLTEESSESLLGTMPDYVKVYYSQQQDRVKKEKIAAMRGLIRNSKFPSERVKLRQQGNSQSDLFENVDSYFKADGTPLPGVSKEAQDRALEALFTRLEENSEQYSGYKDSFFGHKFDQVKKLSTNVDQKLGEILKIVYQDPNCPNEISAWEEFVRNGASTLNPPNISSGRIEQAKEMGDKINLCKWKLNVMGYGKCIGPLEDAITTSIRKNAEEQLGHRFTAGFNVSDENYYAEARPALRDLPPELKDGLPENYREIAAEKGWTVFKYASRTVPNPPYGSKERVLFYVPGEDGGKVDKWIQFTLPEDPNNNERLIDYISIDKKEPPEKNRIFFTQFWRDENSRNPQNRLHIGARFDTCYSCHPNGMRELSPRPGSYSEEDAPALDFINERMKSYGEVDWAGAVEPKNHVPMGSDQGCVQCHNNYEGSHPQSRGAINEGTYMGIVQHKMTEDYSMPPTLLNSEKELFSTLKEIPTTMSKEELAKFRKNLARGNYREGELFEASIKELFNLDKVSQEQKDRLIKIINGSSDYPDCIGKPDCFIGIKKEYANLYQDLAYSTPTPAQKADYYSRGCAEIREQEYVGAMNGSGVNINDRLRSTWDAKYNSFNQEIESYFGGQDNER